MIKMTKGRVFIAYRRKEKTDYGKRLSLLKSRKPRLVVRISNKNITAQIVEYIPTGDKVLFAVSSRGLEKVGWKASKKSEPAAYLTGYMIAKKSAGKISDVVLDIGKHRSVVHSRIYAVAKGALDGGMNLNVSEDVLPDEKRISGNHISEYAKLISSDKEKYNKVFSSYLKNGIKPEELSKHFEQIKSKI
jgi:large subunit ribosomal protein L18